ncbi:MAG: hypothetical protein Q8940_07305 [Bacteroidota bacterium]|nr:hypothetical protein [Bacteroidota bacterium]
MYIDAKGSKATIRFTAIDFRTKIARIAIAYIKSLPYHDYDKQIHVWTITSSPAIMDKLAKLEKQSEILEYNGKRKKARKARHP